MISTMDFVFMPWEATRPGLCFKMITLVSMSADCMGMAMEVGNGDREKCVDLELYSRSRSDTQFLRLDIGEWGEGVKDTPRFWAWATEQMRWKLEDDKLGGELKTFLWLLNMSGLSDIWVEISIVKWRFKGEVRAGDYKLRITSISIIL